MLRKSLAKSHDECLWDCVEAYRKEHAGTFRMEDVAQWSLDTGLLSAPEVKPVRLLTRSLKQAARRRRFRDAQGRTVRQALPAKTEYIDENGNRVIGVVWDYLHEMSLDHALTAFSQRDEIIEKQRLAATRDVQSVIDNNPNVAGHESQFRFFSFMLEEPATIAQEAMAETPLPPSAGRYGASETTSISKRKPR